jgi:SAM-dependent methyltransferase
MGEPMDMERRYALLSARYANDGRPALPLNDLQREMVQQVAAKVASGSYRMEPASCCVCGGIGMEVLAEKDRYGLPVPTGICRACGLIQAPRRLDAESSAEFYRTEYRPLYVGREYAGDEYFAKHYEIGRRVLRDVEGLIPHGTGRPLVLEVGCGSGGILKCFRDSGWNVCGLDLDAEAVEYGRSRHGLDLRVGTVGGLDLQRAPDLVLYCDCLEHLPDPAEELRAAAPLLAGGLLYVSVPGVMRLARTHFMDFLLLLQNAHVHNFTARTLRNVVTAAGYETVRIDERIRGFFRPRCNATAAAWDSDYDRVMGHLRRMESACRLLPARGRLKVLGRRLLSRLAFLQRWV